MTDVKILEKIKNLLKRQQCRGATLQEEILCLQKVIEITLKEDVIEIDLDKVIRRLYKLKQIGDNTL